MLNPIDRMLNKIHDESIKRDDALAESLNAVIHQQAMAGQIGTLDKFKQVYTHIYQSATTYTNLIMLGGYAGIFAVWQMTKQHLDRNVTILTALLMCTSLFLFAGYEVYKMIRQAFFLRQLDRVLLSKVAQADLLTAWQQAWMEYSAKESRVWLFALIPTVATGFGAGAILIYTFAKLLIN
jgi:hypothetical protein